MEQRRTQRFKLQLPLSVTRAGAQRVTLAGVTNNISSSGVLFTVESGTTFNSPIEYIITLNHDGPQAVNLRCIGKIVRAERVAETTEEQPPAYQVAATLERYEFIRDR